MAPARSSLSSSRALLCAELAVVILASLANDGAAEMASRCSKWHRTRYLTLGCEFPNLIRIDGAFYGFSARERNCFYQANDCTENTTFPQCNGVSTCTVAVARSNLGKFTCGLQAHDYLQVHYRCIPDSFGATTTTTSGNAEVVPNSLDDDDDDDVDNIINDDDEEGLSASTLRPPTVSWIVPTIVIETNPTTAATTTRPAAGALPAAAVDEPRQPPQNLTFPHAPAHHLVEDVDSLPSPHVASHHRSSSSSSSSPASLFLVLAILLGVALFVLLVMIVVVVVLKRRFAEVPYDDLPVKTNETTSFVPHSVYVFEKKSLEALAAENSVAALKGALAGGKMALGGGATRSESRKELVLDMVVETEKNSESGLGVGGNENDADKSGVVVATSSSIGIDADVSAGNPRYERQPSALTTASGVMNASMTSSMMARNDAEHIYEALELDHYENCAAAKLRTRADAEVGEVGGDGGEGGAVADERPPLPPLPDTLPRRKPNADSL